MPQEGTMIHTMPSTEGVHTPPASPLLHETQKASEPEAVFAVTKWADVLVRACIVLLFGFLPLFVIPTSWAALAQGKMLFVSTVLVVAVISWVVARIAEGRVRVPRSILLYAITLLPIAYLISAVVSGWSSASVVAYGVEQDTLVAVVLWFTALLLGALALSDHRATIRRAVRAFSTGLCVLGVYQTLYVLFPSIFGFGLLQSTTANLFGSWHGLGILMGLSLFLSFALFRSGLMDGLWRIVTIGLGLTSTFLLIIIHFQDVLWGTAILLCAGALAVALATRRAMPGDWHSLARAVFPWLVVTIIFGALGFVSTNIENYLPERVRINEVEVRPSWQGTFDIAKQSLSAPTAVLFGAGPNSFIREWGRYKPEEVNLTPFWNSDFNYGVGTIPTSVFSVGLFGLLAWLALVAGLLWLSFIYIRDTRPLTSGRVLFGALLLALIYLISFHMIYTPGLALTGVTFLLLALLVVAGAGETQPREFSLSVRTTTGILSLVVVIGGAGIALASAGAGAREVISNLYVNRAAYSFQNDGDVIRAGDSLSKALFISPYNDRAHRAAAELGIVQLGQLLAAEDTESDEARNRLQETLQQTIQHGLVAVEIDETNYQNWLLLAQIYSDLGGANVEGALDQAQAAYERAFEASPTNPVPKLRLAQIAVAREDLDTARTRLQEAIALKPDFTAAYYLLSQVEAASKNGDAAVQAGVAVVQLVPEDPLGWFNIGYILYSGGIYQDAAVALERAATLSQDYANALFILGLTYNQLGRTDEAVAVLSRVVELNPQETWLSELIENVRAGVPPTANAGESVTEEEITE